MAKSSLLSTTVSCWLISLCFAGQARAVPGRDFAGFYELSDVREVGEDYQLTFAVRLFNYSRTYVTNASLLLRDPIAPDVTYAIFRNISLRDRESVRLSSLVRIPRREYVAWQKGGRPAVEISFTRNDGRPARQRVELVRAPVGEER